MKAEEKDSYKNIVKTTGMFGGVQVFKILISVIKSKLVAILLGPTGMGISGLLSSTIGLVTSFTNFGLSTSAVTDVSAANATNDLNKISSVIIALRRMVWLTGVLGTLVALIFSKYLSELTFGNNDYTYAFVWLSFTLLFAQLSVGQNVVLQGMRKLQFLAKANILGSILGLITSIPLFYFFGNAGIVPSIILSSISTLLISWYYSKKVIIPKQNQSVQETIKIGRGMLSMGFMLSLTGIINLGTTYLLSVYIAREGGIDDVGLYNAGFAIINTYVGLIFTAMVTDYYPRLAGVATNDLLVKNVVNQQAEVAILILAPILMIFLIYIEWIVVLFYSNEFVRINEMIQWAALGIFFKSASWSISFVFLAKGAGKLFFFNELIAQIYVLLLNLIGFKYFGFEGMGISSLLIYILYLVQVFVIAKKKYSFNFSPFFLKIFFIQFILAIVCFLIIRYLSSPFCYVLGSFIILISTYYSYNILDKYMGIKGFIRNFVDKYRNK